MATVSELLTRVTDSSTGRPVIAGLASPGKALGATSINIDSATNWTTGSPIYISIYNTTTVGGVTVKDPTTQTDWKGVLAGTTVGSLTLTGGTDREYTAGAIVEQTATSRYAKDLYDWATSFANTDGSLKAGPIQTALNLGSSSLNGWNVLGTTISAVTNNGNRSYSLTTAADVSGTLSPGMRLRTTRTVAAPNQSASLNGTTQYFSKAAPAGMTFTNNFVVSAWVKLSAYGSAGIIASRMTLAAGGWEIKVEASGQITCGAYNGSSSNASYIISAQSIPLNKWVHIAGQLDMATFTATPTTSYIMIDGVDVPSTVARNGTNPTSLTQAGNLEIGSRNGGTVLFPGKIAQVAVYGAKVTQATIRGTMSQGLVGTETSLITAHSLSNSLADLVSGGTALTANNGVLTTNADSPFGGQAGGAISTTLDYGIIQSVTSTTLTVQVAEGCTIPTSGGISSVSYAITRSPYGFPSQKSKWDIVLFNKTTTGAISSPTASTVYNIMSLQLVCPIGSWNAKVQLTAGVGTAAAGNSSLTINLTGSATSNVPIVSGLTVVRYMNVSAATYSIDRYVMQNMGEMTFTSATTLYLTEYTNGAANTIELRNDFANEGGFIMLENAYL